jgi:hypothetical protein
MCKSHRRGSTKTVTGYNNYWKSLRPLVSKPATNAFCNDSNLKFYEKRRGAPIRELVVAGLAREEEKDEIEEHEKQCLDLLLQLHQAFLCHTACHISRS